MKKCMNNENKLKKKGKKVLPLFEDKNPWRNFEENDKNLARNLGLIE